MTDTTLESRIWRAIELSADPSGLAVALHTFLPACSLSVRADVPTARIRRSGDRIDLEFGEAFLREHLSDDRDLLFVLLHEVYHHVLGHLILRPGDELSKQCPQAANLAADMLVNRTVIDRYFPRGVPLLSSLYGNGVPACLLKPPDTFVKGAGKRNREQSQRGAFIDSVTGAGCSHEIAKQAWGVHRMGWKRQPPYEQLLEHVVKLLDSAGALRVVPVLLLGDHDGPPVDGLPWPCDATEPGAGGALDESWVESRASMGDLGLAQALRRALEKDPARRLVQMVPMTGVVCSPGRSDLAFLAGGHVVSIFHGSRPVSEEALGAHVYLDVSGSMDDVLPCLFNGLNALRDLVATPLHQFSTEVVDCSMDDLARGVKRTTGGTHLRPVLEHALARRYGQIVVISDGFVGDPGSIGDRFAQSGISLHVVLTGASSIRRRMSPLVSLARTVTSLG